MFFLIKDAPEEWNLIRQPGILHNTKHLFTREAVWRASPQTTQLQLVVKWELEQAVVQPWHFFCCIAIVKGENVQISPNREENVNVESVKCVLVLLCSSIHCCHWHYMLLNKWMDSICHTNSCPSEDELQSLCWSLNFFSSVRILILTILLCFLSFFSLHFCLTPEN